MDTWAHCPTCVRWFYVARATGGHHTCPVCLAEPDGYEERESVTVVTSAEV